MRGSRLLSRLRHERSRYSPFSCSIAQIHVPFSSRDRENHSLAENKFANYQNVLEYAVSCPNRFSQRRSFAAFGDFLAASSSSKVVPPSSLIVPSSVCFHRLQFTRSELFFPLNLLLVLGGESWKVLYVALCPVTRFGVSRFSEAS